ncbi:chromosome segregation protein SMC [Aeribacillus pallidus]|uniref:Chromosome partition protein Smc n=1 Tax=Aeribacillus pallidus TaxID=33936 RepID=A0A165X705_9BACI|nr:chromosome segregation protein SMC [Aeribacillus pallidus]KZN95699.1 chromosome segregation protein SMC [Aeribacillus pallidus]
MFLKRLDIVGFKSFADRISVDFAGGVTAVVGPNGSGKSNITEAIRWVLGEQSAKSLRGSKMEDIIFAGSDTRKRLNMAEVTLTLDNGDQFLPIDYHEVSVTRRVYRSGESEFFINKQSCRLKDIIDLFMDSGLGKEAFSIISQGKVEEILSAKPEDRRTIFEEAAGVLKYKTRKKKAEIKLAETEENLNRVQDILYELNAQIEPLKMQASIAKDYLDKKEELKQHEVALLAHEIEELHDRWEALKRSVEENRDRELELTSQIQKKEANLEEMRDQISALDESINDLQQVLLLASEELEKLEGKKEVLKERKKHAAQNEQQLKEQIAELTEQINQLLKEKEEQKSVYETCEKEVKELKSFLQKKENELLSLDGNIEEKLEQLKSDYFEKLNELASARNEINYIEEQLSLRKVKADRLDEANEKYISERKELKKEKGKIEAQLSKIGKTLQNQLSSYHTGLKTLESLKQQYEKKESLLYQAYQYLQKAKSKKEMLEAMQEDYNGFFQGVREVLKAKHKLKGIHGAAIELLTTKHEYETAIEIALGAASQHIVVDDEESARQAIAFLKKNAFGRATFLPLSVIKGRSIPKYQLSIAESHPDFIGIASQLVEYESAYKPIIENLLGNVIIAKTLEGANAIAKQIQYSHRIVTLEGDVVNPGGSMTGGAVKQKSPSFLTKNRELESIRDKIAEMEEKTASLEKEVKNLKQSIAKKEKELDDLREEGSSLRMEEQALKGSLREIELKERNINDHLKLYDAEKIAYVEEQEKLDERKTKLLSSIEQMEGQIQQLDSEIRQLAEKKEKQQKSKEEWMEEITELKIILAGKEESFKNSKEQLARLEKEYHLANQKKKEAEKDLQLLLDEIDRDHSGEIQLEEIKKEKLEDKNKTIELIASRRRQRMSMQEELEREEKEWKELKRAHKQLTDVLKDEEVKLNRLDVELDQLLNYLQNEYKLTFEAAKARFPLQMEKEEAKKKVKLIKLALEELGTVNLGAIDEYERVRERHEFLTEQRDDLLNAKETLFKVIAEMDEEMKKQFSQMFAKIRSQFDIVFKELFGGGKADLILTNPDDLLNTGVDIIAQPPGKKLQYLSLLSGGERALTAIALLFSILKVRPVPFCVLDEVEAALDEANVQRFSKFLKRFSENTQFIVITHRKGTMEEADALYGVTMQESGVSKVVSVRLEDTVRYVKSS